MNNWTKHIHVKSSLEPNPKQFAMFIGRFQPFHDGHKALFYQALSEGKNILVAIRDVQPDEKNPFTSKEVKENIENYYHKAILDNIGAVQIIIIPDISSIEFGRGVGYDIIEHIPPTEISEISATKIREKMRQNGTL